MKEMEPKPSLVKVNESFALVDGNPTSCPRCETEQGTGGKLHCNFAATVKGLGGLWL